jgi:hypothetical protein
MHMSDLNVKLAKARMAVQFVLKKAKHVANWDERLAWSAEAIWIAERNKAEAKGRAALAQAKSPADRNRINQQMLQELTQAKKKSEDAWNEGDRCVYGKLRQDAAWQRMKNQGGVQSLKDIQLLSTSFDKHGCGNCGELTSKAFIYLHQLGIRPLEYMVLEPGAAQLDHAFVVIGRQEGPNDDPLGRNWVKGAVVCDPWAYGLYRALAPKTLGPPSIFGDDYTVYPTDQMEKKMTTIHGAWFAGVTITFRAD